jgi:hypothetical protein
MEELTMKKLMATILTTAMLLSLAACNNNDGEELDKASGNQSGGSMDGNGNTDGNQEDSTDPHTSVGVGDMIQLGGYDWLVLDIQDSKALIISDKILEKRAYHSEAVDITWEHSDIREFLNSSFYETTFTEQEKAQIAQTNVVNNDSPEYDTSGGNGTTDKIFLLSIEEVNTYFTDDSSRIARDTFNNVHGWWLRSPGLFSSYAAYVYGDGIVRADGFNVDFDGGVRPALWINL